jgi:hypothetical protein
LFYERLCLFLEKDMKKLLILVRSWLHALLMCVPAYERRYTLRLFLLADGRYLEDLLAQDGPINDEYCWGHYPGGWTCPLCRKGEVQV